MAVCALLRDGNNVGPGGREGEGGRVDADPVSILRRARERGGPRDIDLLLLEASLRGGGALREREESRVPCCGCLREP
jgi:hypothetical protein